MLPRSKRLTISLFKEVMDKGRLFHSPFFSAKMLKKPGSTRFSVAVSKKVAKKAVDRNKIRRRTYSILRIYEKDLIEGVHGVFMVKSTILKASFADVSKEMKEFFVKTGLLK